ncbi:hypothetical protein B7494_g2061 [Chlorociboria aeruginascens]|nr:hypothetical protein B7494_g2061 [Chlorociboria aeruginascens]
MSLNGLDDVKVKEAYDTAAAEPGGWFLLKYATRDEVELLGKGTGGILEIRGAIAKYEEPSPLFGFLRYRRRNVVIKYVPDDCSRLFQVRVTVHFNAVVEKFSPHDTIFSITNSKELRDTTLSAACSLHTASGSTSSSTSSLRRRRLMEIAEEEEDNRTKRQSTVQEERPPTAKAPSGSPPALPTDPLEASVSSNKEPKGPLFETPNSPTKSMDEPRKSSQSLRPDFSSYSSYGSNGKPKVKLGPRPSLDVGGRNHTSATSRYRPVSTLPSGLKIFQKGSRHGRGNVKSQNTREQPSMTLSPLETMSPPSHTVLSRPHTSGGPSESSSSQPLISPTFNTHKRPTITPEKLRLMKAIELRKKQMTIPSTPAPPLIATDASVDPAPSDEAAERGPLGGAQDTLAMLQEMTERDDSAIAFDASSTLRTDESDATRSDSYPVSPTVPSERAESTKASSISESTDETVQDVSNSKAVMTESEAVRDEETPEPLVTEHTEEIEITSSEVDEKISTNVETESLSEPQIPEVDKTISTSMQSGTESLPVGSEELGLLAPFTEVPAAEPEIEALPQLLPIAYKPPPTPIRTKRIIPKDQETVYEEPTNITSSANDIAKAVKADENAFESPRLELVISKFSQVPAQIALEKTVTPSPPLSPTKSLIDERRIPRSKFSLQNLRATGDGLATPDEPLPSPLSPKSLNAMTFGQKSPVGSTFSDTSKRSFAAIEQENERSSNWRRKPKDVVEPIRTDLEKDKSAANSDANFSSDDELLDELQSAVLQDALPISVSKSSMSPMPSPNKEGNRFSRAFSNPLRKDKSDSQLLTPPNMSKKEPLRSVSASAAYLSRINQQSANKPIATKVNVGSGISQRIKALEKLSSLSPGTASPAPPGSSSGSSPAFFSVRNGNIQPGSRSPSIAERASSLTRNTPSPSVSRESSPEAFKIRDRSESLQRRMSTFDPDPVPTMPSHHSRPESVSVTARIIRDPEQPFPQVPELGQNLLEYKPLDLKQSPLVIDHQKATTSNETIQERRLSTSSKSSKQERRSSITIVRDLIKDTRNSFSERRRSGQFDRISSPSIKSPSRPPSTHASSALRRPVSTSSREQDTLSPPPTAGSSSSNSEEKVEKKSNRASRIIRRMSSSLSASRKSIAHSMSPTVREELEPPFGTSGASSPSQGSIAHTQTNIGDVNVQFPDTLLWKRRSVILDSNGFLVLSPALTASGNVKDKANAGATRRFHLSDFRTPAVPDVEMQELPNSVVLDFMEGGGLQIACEDKAGQEMVLRVLQEAHRSQAAYGQ